MKNTRLITEGAVLLAVYTILLLAALYVPILSAVLMFALPIPFIMFNMRYTEQSSLLLLTVASFITIIVSSPLQVATTLTFGTTGIVIGMMYKRKRRYVEVLLASTIAYTVNIIVLYIVSAVLLEYNFIKEMQTIFMRSVEQAEALMKSSGTTADNTNIEAFKQAVQMIGYLTPTLIVLGSFLAALFTQLISVPVLKRLRYEVQPTPPFHSIRLPRSILIYYVLFLALSIFVKAEEGSYLYIAQLNLQILFSYLMVVQGLSLIAFFFKTKEYPKAVFIISIIITLFVPIVFSLVSFLGIIDIGFSPRKYIENKK